MSSSTLAGERRWATSRKSGMTALGKVTVPKPLNLPSQRLENHGIDPNVAIVPKGTLSWGNREPSASSDAKHSSSLLPYADGGMSSPNHRPSSGGSGTRPSTAGSDRTHEPISSAWGSNSRPSSAAGTLPSNQTPLSSRPRSAETRPSSSHLSRFSEPVVKNLAAWDSSITTETLAVKQDGFSLNSGDFPTLGSEREDSSKNTEYADQCRPKSASGTSVQPEKDIRSHTDIQCGNFGTRRVEDPQGKDGGIHPPRYLHPNPPPQHFDQWRGRPVNAPDGLWDRSQSHGPQCRPPIGPNGFPVEPFPYYRPQLPPPHLAGSLPVPPTGAAPRGPQPQNGTFYRPHIHDNYARPGMPFRPSFYPGTRGPMPFEGYYGPPHMAYRNNEQDLPFIGVGAGHPAYDGYTGGPGAVPNLGNSQGRAGGYGPSGKPVPDKVEVDHLEDSYRGKRIHSNPKTVGENWEDRSEPRMLYPRKDYLPAVTSLNNKMGVSEHAKEDAFGDRIAPPPTENLVTAFEHRGHFAENKTNKAVKLGKTKAVYNSWNNISEEKASFPTNTSQIPLAGGIDSTAPTKDSALMQKIEGLNAKIRVSDVRNDASVMYDIDGHRSRSKAVKDDYLGEVISTASQSFKKAPIYEDVPVSHQSMQPVVAVPRRPYNDGHSGDNYRGKGKSNIPITDGWQRKAPSAGSSSVVSASNAYSVTPGSNPVGHNFVAETFENSLTDSSMKNEADIAGSHDDSTNNNQRAKMRELAKQRALQRQKEEEERAREQKAKALAKLEELNRQTLAGGESGNQKPENTIAVDQNQKESTSHEFEEFSLSLASRSDIASLERNTIQPPVEFVEDVRNLSLEMQLTDILSSEALHLPVCKDSLDTVAKKIVHQTDDSGILTHKTIVHGQNQKFSPGTSSGTDPVHYVASEAQKDHIWIGTIDITLSEGPLGETRGKEPTAPNISNALVQPTRQQRTNNYSKNRNKPDVTPSSSLPAPPLKNGTVSNKIFESGSSFLNINSSVAMAVSTQEVSPLPVKESQSKVALNRRRTQPSRRMPRGQQAYRLTDKLHGDDSVMWAPVNKAKDFVETDSASFEESVNQTSIDDYKSQNSSSKSKRADMERYVTKAVVKESVLQGTVPLSSLCSSRSNEGLVKAENPQPAAGSISETTSDVNGRHNKRKKGHEVRSRQLIAADSYHTEGGHLKPWQAEVEQSKEQNEPMKGENLLANPKISDASHTSYHSTSAAAGKHLPRKDQGMGRVKRHHDRGSRATRTNPNPENISGGDNIEGSGTHSASLDVDQTDKPSSSTEIQNSTEHSYSHWKPKSNTNSASTVSVTASVSVAKEGNQLAENDNVMGKAKVLKSDNETDIRSSLQQVQNVQRKPGEKSITGRHREFNKDKKPAQSKVRPFPRNEDHTSPGDTEDQQEYDNSSVSMKNRSQSNSYFRGHKSHRDWSSSHDFRAHNAPPPHMFRERQRQNMHYEYKPVDHSKSDKPKKVVNQGLEETESLIKQNYQDNGPSQSKRSGGNFYRRQSGAAHVDSGHN